MIQFLTTKLPRELSLPEITHLADVLTRGLRIKKPLDISLSFVTLGAIQTLNKQYRKKDRPTDVLSFSLLEAGLPKGLAGEITAWGDVIICSAYAKEEAKRRGLPLKEELLRLVVHGVLHLAGYDHAKKEDELKMFQLQERLLEQSLDYAD